jgi:hypothetical protein
MWHKMKSILDSVWFKLFSVAVSAFNGWLLLCIGSKEYADGFILGWGRFGSFFVNNGGYVVVISLLIAGLYPTLYGWIAKKSDDLQARYDKLSRDYDIALLLLEKLESVVAQKRERFATLCDSFKSTVSAPKHKTVFTQITQPEEQFKHLLTALRDCLMHIYPNEFIKIALMQVQNNEIFQWQCHAPYDTRPRTSIAALKHPNSTFSKCLSTKKMVIVGDTQKELRKTPPDDILYIQGNTDTNEKWCQVCDPVISITTNEVIFIVSIAIKRADVITKDNEEFLVWLLKFFRSRLALEHSLKQIKEMAT